MDVDQGEYWQQLDDEEDDVDKLESEGYVNYYVQVRDEYLRERLKNYPNTEFNSFELHFSINRTNRAPLIYAILDRISKKTINENNISIVIDSETEFLENLRFIQDLYYIVHSWVSVSLFYNGVDFHSSTGWAFLMHYIWENHKNYPLCNTVVDYLPKKTRNNKSDKTEEFVMVRISRKNPPEALHLIVSAYIEMYGKNKDVQIYDISELEKVVMLENCYIVDFRMTPGKMPNSMYYKEWESPYVVIQELTYNNLFNFVLASFWSSFESDNILFDFFPFLRMNYYLEENQVFNDIDRQLPELNLKQRIANFSGEKHHFIILRMVDVNGEIKYGIGETQRQIHTFVLNLCRELEKKNPRSVMVHSVYGLPIEYNYDFIKAFVSWKGEKKRWRLENKFSYYYEDRDVRNELDSYTIRNEILGDAKAGKYDHYEFGSYTKPLNKWKSEELVYNIAKDIYKDYQVIYQYKPAFLSTQTGNMSYDVYICGLKTAIEYQGKQHFEPVDYYGGLNNFKKQQERDRIKAEKSRENGVKLVYINYWEDITVNLIRERVEG